MRKPSKLKKREQVTDAAVTPGSSGKAMNVAYRPTGKRGDKAREELYEERAESDRQQLYKIETMIGERFPGWYAKNANFKSLPQLVGKLLDALEKDADAVRRVEPPPEEAGFFD